MQSIHRLQIAAVKLARGEMIRSWNQPRGLQLMNGFYGLEARLAARLFRFMMNARRQYI